ncbi:hypothetical protein ACLOJK_032038 [Asimina triloba]
MPVSDSVAASSTAKEIVWDSFLGRILKKMAALKEKAGNNNSDGRLAGKVELRGRVSFAPQFDGLHCFETFVSHS